MVKLIVLCSYILVYIKCVVHFSTGPMGLTRPFRCFHFRDRSHRRVMPVPLTLSLKADCAQRYVGIVCLNDSTVVVKNSS